MIHIRFVDVSNVTTKLYEHCLNRLPVDHQLSVKKYRHRNDRCLALFGKLLIQKLSEDVFSKPDILSQLHYTDYGKPYLSGHHYFNISHSGNYVICAVTKQNPIGVDIEKHSDINFSDFKLVLSDSEWITLHTLDNPIPYFFDLWAIKESVIKADGKGLSLDLKKIKINDSFIHIYPEKETLYYRKLDIDSCYSCSVSSYQPIDAFNLEQIDVEAFHV